MEHTKRNETRPDRAQDADAAKVFPNKHPTETWSRQRPQLATGLSRRHALVASTDDEWAIRISSVVKTGGAEDAEHV